MSSWRGVAGVSWPRVGDDELFFEQEQMMTGSVVKMATLAATAACVLAVATPAQAQDTKIVLGMSGWTGFAPLTLADKAGIFKKNGWMWRSR